MNIFTKMYIWTTRKTPLYFGSRPHLEREDPKTENFNFAALFIVYLCGQAVAWQLAKRSDNTVHLASAAVTLTLPEP